MKCEIMNCSSLVDSNWKKIVELTDQFLKKLLADYLKSEFSKILPDVIREAVRGNPLFIGQEFISIKSAMIRFNLSRKTIYNYHNRGHVTLHTSDGKTFISIVELEAHIRNNPLTRKSDQTRIPSVRV